VESEFMIAPIRSAGVMHRAWRFFRRLSRDQHGSIAILAALSLVIVLAFAGLGVDAALWMRTKNNAQSAADAAAGAVASAVVAINPASRLTAEANAAAAANGFQNGINGVTVTMNNPPASGPNAGNVNAYEVIITAPQKLYLASALAGTTAPNVRGRAVALVTLGPSHPPFPTCILGLSPLANNVDVTFNGSTVVNANACDVDADSPSSSSVNTNGGGSIHAKAVRTVGGVSGGNIFVTDSPGIYTQQSNIPDPYADRTIPSMPAFSPSPQAGQPIRNPTGGVVAFNGNVNISGNVTIDPGIYIISNGSLNMGANDSLTGTGVTIILTSPTPSSDNGVFSINGQASLSLTAPATGPTAGIALWADKNLPNTPPGDKFDGGSAANTVGAIYLPSHDVKWAGNNKANSKCMQLIAYNIVFTGSSTFNHNCDGVGTSDPQGAPKPTGWALVE
jgi:Flp pilus assembly protein TadG